MILSTTNTLQGKEIEKYLGIVSGETILGANIVRDFLASVTDVIGGRSRAYESKLSEAREIAINEMVKRAEQLGANAVIGIKFDFEAVGQRDSMLMCIATGTAVRVR